MKYWISLLVLVTGVFSAPSYHSLSLLNNGGYQFAYDTGKESGSHSRTESKDANGLVVGKYSYEDPTGDLRVVYYKAGDFGYVAKGAVGVAGAPESQFPAEPVESSEDGTDKQPEQKAGEEDKGEESKSDEVTHDDDDENSDDMKPTKIRVPSADNFPEAFPIGFFDQGFQGLRRFPEPTKESPEEVKPTDADDEKKDSTTPTESDDSKATTHSQYFPPLLPFANFQPHTWAVPLAEASSEHHPVYVYSYQMPNAHGYYYHY